MSKRKSILIYNSTPLFPQGGMNIVRVYNQILTLSRDHNIDFMFLETNNAGSQETYEKLSPICRRVIPIKTFNQTYFYKVLKKLILKKFLNIINYPVDYFNLSNPLTAKKIANTIKKRKYDVIISHYWQASGFFKYLPISKTTKCIDTHYIVEENLILLKKGAYNHLNEKKYGSLLRKELKLQNKWFKKADLLVVNSFLQKDLLKKVNSIKPLIVIPNGQKLNHYLNYDNTNLTKNDLKILFYGALGNQFNEKAVKRIVYNIIPMIKKKLPGIKLIIMGSGRPKWLEEEALSNKNINFLGFVKDVRPVFHQCLLSLIPLESGSGFRGRTIELLASGIPIIGTYNALASVKIEHGINGIIAESDEAIAKWTIELIKNNKLRNKISINGIDFAIKNYSLDVTFGKLSKYFQEKK